jgi:uncharacterized protein with FMN-binding domain
MTKKILTAAAVLVAISLAWAACFVELDPDDIAEGEPITDASGNLVSRNATATATSYLGGTVTVTLTVKDGKITAVDITGEHETAGPGFGEEMMTKAKELIKRANSVDIDAVTTATTTLRAIKEAGKKALAEITGTN